MPSVYVGEVADQAGRPVDVLQHADASFGTSMPTSVRMRSFQAAGRSSTLEIAAHQRELQLEAQEDVQVVGDLVGLDADQRRLDQVGGAHERVERDVLQLLGERGLDLGQVALPERARAADHVLPEARLRLVEAERRGGAAERALDRRP